MLKIVVYALLVFPSKALRTTNEEMYLPEEEEKLPVKILNHKSGDEVIMKCKDHESSNMQHRWRFLACDNCDTTSVSEKPITHQDWKVLPQLKKRLTLKSVSPANNGKYICTVNNNVIASYQLKVAKTQQLNQEIRFIGRPPEIVAIEKKENISPNDNVAVKCKITSPLVPRIWWLKQCEDTPNCNKTVNYDGKFYYKINVTYQDMQLEENVYVSKLHLRNFTHRDDGLYVCVTMTELGKDYRTFTLTLPPSAMSDDDANAESQTSNLYYLFLVPVVFILIPICIDCVGKRVGIRKTKQEVLLLEVLPNSNPRNFQS